VWRVCPLNDSFHAQKDEIIPAKFTGRSQHEAKVGIKLAAMLG
jgi:hypothetical protein